MKNNTGKAVIIVTSLKLLSGQQQLAGILDANLGKMRWRLSVIDCEDFTVRRLLQAFDTGADGFIVHLPGTKEAMRLLLETDVPTVFVNIGGFRLPQERRHLSYFWTENAEIGRLGAEHFLAKDGYRSFAFVSTEAYKQQPDDFWSRERKRGFCERLQREGIACTTRPANERLDHWLLNLAKPAALMASHDAVAVRLVDDCRRLGLDVPDDVSVLGVDGIAADDQGISSVGIDFRRAGQMEVRELDALMRQPKRHGAAELLIPVKGVLCRKSTSLPVRSDVPARALRFIAENACSGISVADVVTHLGCSRRLAEIKFRLGTARTIKAEIERIRLIQARKRLKLPGATLRKVAQACGYSSATILSRALVRTAAS